ncbi:hypothetical protein E2C01_082282 [Portunus trituberculatus]|uniref:Uncharacterized protein n=1 Tax=Portunus trituberculatus TaxID=210409 RepID=A0A5B7IRY5_PORTR|nr:hypothetical protein [Portunus trituberculatus]
MVLKRTGSYPGHGPRPRSSPSLSLLRPLFHSYRTLHYPSPFPP